MLLDAAVLKAYRNRLTNLTGRNRSLLLTRLPAEQFLDLQETDFLLNKPAFDLIVQLLNRNGSVPVCDVLDSRHERVNEVSKKLGRIARTAQFITDERGTEDLYVGWPFVRGKFMDNTVVHGPLLFFPVKLEQQQSQWHLVRRVDARAILNSSFALAYSYFNQVQITDDVLEKEFTDVEKDATDTQALAFRTYLYEWLKTTPLKLNFNTELFTDKLQFFNKLASKDLDVLEHTGELKLYPEAVLGIFPQAGSFLVPDYETLLGSLAAGAGPEAFSDLSSGKVNVIREEQLHTPLPLDASQEAAIRAVKAGQSLVVQGPPGTGKSQLIANLMADAAAGGKRVLLVCQKRAALDVVYERLQGAGLGSFIALIHDFQNDRRNLYAQIRNQVEEVEKYRTQNYNLDAVLLERDFDTVSRRIDQLVSELDQFKEALFDTSDCGLSVKELYLTSVPAVPETTTRQASLDVSDVYQQFRFDQLDAFGRQLADYTAYQQRLGPNHLFAERVSFGSFSSLALPAVGQAILAVSETGQTVAAQTKRWFAHPPTLSELTDWTTADWSLSALLTLADGPDAELRWQLTQFLLENPTHPAGTADEAQLTDLAETWDRSLLSPGPELTLPAADLPPFRTRLQEAIAARSSWLSWQWWQLNNPGKAALLSLLTANALTPSLNDLQILAVKLDRREQLESVRQHAIPLLTFSPDLPVEPRSLRLLHQSRMVAEALRKVVPMPALLPSVRERFSQFAPAVRSLLALAEVLQTQLHQWKRYLTATQINRIWQEPAYGVALDQTLRLDFDLLVEADRLQERFSEAEASLVERLKAIEPVIWQSTLQNAFRLAWIAHIEQKHPILCSVSSLRMTQMEDALQASIQQKRALSQAILLVRLREQTYRNLTFNRLNNLTTYRELHHQTTKKRNVWPIRKLVERYGDEIFRLVPCWLASPESVSAIFPLIKDEEHGQLFDVVIFDEASQCFAENGIPAMARGKQVVVAGDTHQLRPSDLYRVRFDDRADQDEVPIELEVESLLELAAQSLPQFALTGHYRSRSLDLIAFSNEHFYNSKLTLLPDFNDINRHEPAIHYHNVKGIWQHHTNPAEADAVVELIAHLATDFPTRSLGIVTFNYHQQQLIQEKLERAVSARTAKKEDRISEPTFVKNIENVQGDERDIIIFSIGYAADERGRLVNQFGSLNLQGGENRLNVAITRARERIYIVTSLWPEQLNVEQSVNEGPKLLKAYLMYALNVAQGKFRPQPSTVDGFASPALLKIKLAAQRPNWQAELPFADLTNKKSGQYQSLILTDDDLYFQQVPKEAHAYRPFALQAKHWPFRRLWSREFWRQGAAYLLPDGDSKRPLPSYPGRNQESDYSQNDYGKPGEHERQPGGEKDK